MRIKGRDFRIKSFDPFIIKASLKIAKKKLPNKPTNAALIIPPTNPGSVGDAAMIEASIQYLRKKGIERVDVLCEHEWNINENIDRKISSDLYFFRDSTIRYALIIQKLPYYDEAYLIGADVIDGSYNPISVRGRVSILQHMSDLGKKAFLLGSSFSKTPNSEITKLLKNLPSDVILSARDPVSRERMETVLERPVRQTADLAFLVKPTPNHPDAANILTWINKCNGVGRKVLALNANYLHLKKCETLVDNVSFILQGLIEKGYSIVLVPHDVRFRNQDEIVLKEAVQKLPVSMREQTVFLPPHSPGAIKAVLAQVNMIVTGRMHAAILAMGTGTPAFCFAYQDKFEGLFSLFDLQEFVLLSSPEELGKNTMVVLNNILDAAENHDMYRSKIKNRLLEVIKLAESNFA